MTPRGEAFRNCLQVVFGPSQSRSVHCTDMENFHVVFYARIREASLSRNVGEYCRSALPS